MMLISNAIIYVLAMLSELLEAYLNSLPDSVILNSLVKLSLKKQAWNTESLIHGLLVCNP